MQLHHSGFQGDHKIPEAFPTIWWCSDSSHSSSVQHRKGSEVWIGKLYSFLGFQYILSGGALTALPDWCWPVFRRTVIKFETARVDLSYGERKTVRNSRVFEITHALLSRISHLGMTSHISAQSRGHAWDSRCHALIMPIKDHCCVPLYQSGVTFHAFPKEELLWKKWIIKIRRDVGKNFKVSRTRFNYNCASVTLTLAVYEITSSTRVWYVHFLPWQIKKSLAGKLILKREPCHHSLSGVHHKKEENPQRSVRPPRWPPENQISRKRLWQVLFRYLP